MNQDSTDKDTMSKIFMIVGICLLFTGLVMWFSWAVAITVLGAFLLWVGIVT